MSNSTDRRIKFNKDPEEKWSIVVRFNKAFPATSSEITSINVTAQRWERNDSANKSSTTEIFQTTSASILADKKSIQVNHQAGTHNYDYIFQDYILMGRLDFYVF